MPACVTGALDGDPPVPQGSKSPLLPTWADRRPILGMLHLPALPGAPHNRLTLAEILARVQRDAAMLVEQGIDGLLLENYGDTPFYPGRVPAAVVAQMTTVALEVRRAHALPLGINVLRNDARSALGVAAAVGAELIRVNILCGARVTDQGLIQGQAHALLRERRELGVEGVRILADVDVKHSAPLGAPRAVAEEVADLVERGGADAVIVTGGGTGRPADREHLRAVYEAAGAAPVLVGSGVTAEIVMELAPTADGFIVGTWLKEGGDVTRPVDPARVRAMVAAVRAVDSC